MKKLKERSIETSDFKVADMDAKALPIIKRVLNENFARYKVSYVLAIFCMFAVAATTAYSAYIIKDVVNDVFEDKSLAKAYSIAALILLIFFVKGIAGFGTDVLLNRIGNNIIARYQNRVYEHMLELGVGFFTGTRSAYLTGQINQNISGVKNLLNQVITVFARDLLTLIGLVFVMIWQDPLMSFGALVVMPIAGFVLSRYVKSIRRLSRKEVNVNSRVTSAMVETAQGIPVVKAFTMEEQLKMQVGKLITTAERQANTITLVNARTKPLTETLGGLAIAGSVAFGGWRVIELGGNSGALLSFLAAAMLAYDPARRLASFRVQFEKSLVNARMLYEFLDSPRLQLDKSGAKKIKLAGGEISLNKVSFKYGEEGKPVLHSISMVAQAGKTTALVGPSGGGKSTIINLILRFYDLDSGTISIDGQDISDVQIQSLRKQMSYVSQSPVLFEGSVSDNIRYGRPDATREEIIEAAKLAQAHEFILNMANGYDTQIGEMGSNISGGQRQRLSIARAIVRDAPILLLDEATSSLDNESEKLVQLALDKLMKNRTTLVIAHRLSTIKNADKIVVLNEGRIVEQGNHKQLIANKSGLFSKLSKLADNATDRSTDTKIAKPARTINSVAKAAKAKKSNPA